MGTLFDQPERNAKRVSDDDTRNFVRYVKRMSEELEVPVADVLQAEMVLELRRQNDLAVTDGDVRDEQLAGLGRLLQDVVARLDEIREEI